ncbi:hypothetical protein ACPZ19_51095 [Amycolatopsis lurida]
MIGYGRTGASAVTALTAEPTELPGPLVVLERRTERLAVAAAAGVRAAAVVVTCMNDATTLELAGLVRHLTTSAKLVVAARAPSQVRCGAPERTWPWSPRGSPVS